MNAQEILSHPAFWGAVAAGSEIIALLPVRSNNWVQLLLQVLHALQPKEGQSPLTEGGHLDSRRDHA